MRLYQINSIIFGKRALMKLEKTIRQLTGDKSPYYEPSFQEHDGDTSLLRILVGYPRLKQYNAYFRINIFRVAEKSPAVNL